MTRNSKGDMRPEGWRPEIDEDESAIVRRTFDMYVARASATGIAKVFNREGLRGRHHSHQTRACWKAGTISYMLDNEKYIGRWVWNKRGTRKDPRTGRKWAFLKPETEWITRTDESLRIIPQDVWDMAQVRRKQCSRIWPSNATGKARTGRRGSYMRYHATHPLAGLLVCTECKGTLGKVSGKSGGYLCCTRATRGVCNNKVLLRLDLAEQVIFDRLREQVVENDKLNVLFDKVKKEVLRLLNQSSRQLPSKTSALAKEQARLDNFVRFISEGNSSEAIAEALRLSERRVAELRDEDRLAAGS